MRTGLYPRRRDLLLLLLNTKGAADERKAFWLVIAGKCPRCIGHSPYKADSQYDCHGPGKEFPVANTYMQPLFLIGFSLLLVALFLLIRLPCGRDVNRDLVTSSKEI